MSENASKFEVPETRKDGAPPKEGDIKIVDGISYCWGKSRYTLRQFYSHSTPEMGPGPGWDMRMSLLNNEWAMKNFGRTFSIKEVFNPSTLPDLPIYEWTPID